MIKTFLSILCSCLFMIAHGQQEILNRSTGTSSMLNFPCSDCILKYDKGTPIENKGVIPVNAQIKLPANGKLSLSTRFNDVDRAKFVRGNCPGTPPEFYNQWVAIDCPGYISRFEITENPQYGSFASSTDLDLIEPPIIPFGIVPLPGSGLPSYVWQNQPITLYTNADWPDNTTIKVTVDIDDQAPLPPNEPGFTRKGSCQDNDLNDFHTWEIVRDDNVPEGLKQNPGNPTEGIWTVMTKTPNAGYEQTKYIYKAIESCPMPGTTLFESHIISETFTSETIFFAWEDFLEDWLIASGVLNMQQAIGILFPLGLHGPPASFTLNANSEFTDGHGLSFNFNLGEKTIFKEAAINGDKVGYRLTQVYRNAANKALGITQINRVYRQLEGQPSGQHDWHIKKEHQTCN